MTKLLNTNVNEKRFIIPPSLIVPLFTFDECDEIVNFLEKKYILRPSTVSQSNLDKNYRSSENAFFKIDSESQWIFDRINEGIEKANDEFFNFDLDGYQNIQYTKYKVNDFYDYHMDNPLSIVDYKDIDHCTRKISASILLDSMNQDFEGGNLMIKTDRNTNDSNLKIKGHMLLFPSFMLHKVTSITKGIRRSLVIWVTGPKFK